MDDVDFADFLIVIVFGLAIALLVVALLKGGESCPDKGYDATKCTSAQLIERVGREVQELKEDLRTLQTAIPADRR